LRYGLTTLRPALETFELNAIGKVCNDCNVDEQDRDLDDGWTPEDLDGAGAKASQTGWPVQITRLIN
jgi:hypothetical protein